MLFLIFILIPIIEIAGFIYIGGALGFWTTALIVFATAYIGTNLLKKQGLETLAKAQNSLENGQIPVDEIFDGLCLLVAGAFLLTPGFFTDIVGFSLFIPECRNLYKDLFVSEHFLTIVRFTNERRTGSQPKRGAPNDITDIDYEIVDEKEDK